MNFGEGGRARRRTIPVDLMAAGALTYATLAFAAPDAKHNLGHRYAAEVRVYDQIHRHILVMADALSEGIVARFPSRFR